MALPPEARAGEWRLEAIGGTAWSLPSGLDLEQAGAPPLHVDARWDMHPFEGSVLRLAHRALG